MAVISGLGGPNKAYDGSLADTGWVTFGTAENSNDGGDVLWTNPTNAQVDDTLWATSGPLTTIQTSQLLLFTNPGLSIGATKVITGVEIRFMASASGGVGAATINSVQLYVDGAVAGDNRQADDTSVSVAATQGPYGTSTSLWSVPGDLSPAQVNHATNFGFALKVAGVIVDGVTVSVDFAEIKVTYRDI